MVNGLRVDTLISALEEKGLVKTLAEPDLISQSGQRAQFLAGSLIPIPTGQPGSVSGTTPPVTTTYYPCGVPLGFEPTVLNTGLINVHLTPQVLAVAATTTPVLVNGTTIPELNSRSADTDVELRDGQELRHRLRPPASAGRQRAFAIALVRQRSGSRRVVPLDELSEVGDRPHRHRDRAPPSDPLRPDGTHIVTPLDTTLPANDVDLFLMGQTERKKKYTEFVTGGGGMQGPYGHVLEAK